MCVVSRQRVVIVVVVVVVVVRGGVPFPPASPRHRARVPARCSPICSRNTEHRQSPRTHVVVAQLGIVRDAPPEPAAHVCVTYLFQLYRLSCCAGKLPPSSVRSVLLFSFRCSPSVFLFSSFSLVFLFL